MRPQIRSIPLSKLECPQFSWAVRNNSKNVSAVLQPDFQQEERRPASQGNASTYCTEAQEHFCPAHEKSILAPNKSCYCIDTRLKPTLFPHPVTCVCTNDPFPPNAEIYRQRKLKMEDQAIGEIMEEIIMENMPPPSPSPVRKSERIMKKIMRSAHIPQQVDLEEQNACVECLARDPILLKRLMDSTKSRKTPTTDTCDSSVNCTNCEEIDECRKQLRWDEHNQFDGLNDTPVKTIDDKAKCKWRNDRTICTCKSNQPNLCKAFENCKCKCQKISLKCKCKKLPNSRDITPRLIKDDTEIAKEVVPVVPVEEPPLITPPEKKTPKKPKIAVAPVEEPPLITPQEKKSPKKPKIAVAPVKEPELITPKEKKTVRKPKKAKIEVKIKSPKPRMKSPVRKWKRPDNIICERFDVTENNPLEYKERPEEQQEEVQFYEHLKNTKAVQSGTSKSSTTWAEQCERTSSSRVKNSTSHKVWAVNSVSGSKTAQKKLSKIPWNFNNQHKTEDPMKDWNGTKYSWSKRFKYRKPGKKIEISFDDFMRSRGGDDVGNKSDRPEPTYFEYKPNLRVRSKSHCEKSNESEETIRRKEEKKYKRGFGRMRVRNWHQALEETARKFLEVEEESEGNELKDSKRKNMLLEEDKNDVRKEASKTSTCKSTNVNDNEVQHGACIVQNLDEELDHDQKQCLQCLMNDVQQKFLGSAASIEHFCRSQQNTQNGGSQKAAGCSKMKQEQAIVSQKRSCDNYSRGHQDYECAPEEELPTIIEDENQAIYDLKAGDKNRELNLTYRLTGHQQHEDRKEHNIPQSALDNNHSNQKKFRPKSAGHPQEESIEKPFFNVIKQRIHSRNKTLDDLEKFRDEHFFETHSTKSYLQAIPEHTCVHRFTVDDRLYPEPLHSDAFGVSCCIHCDKPMKNEKTVFLDQRDSRERLEATPSVQRQISKFSLRPKPVHIGSKNSVMEIKLKPEHGELLKCEVIEKARKISYTNSLALRHQSR